jgi:hypothetical protein
MGAENKTISGLAPEETLSRIELQIEQEKLKLERERMLLERERLESVRARIKVEEGLRTDKNGKLAVSVSTLVMASIICVLVGGILGAFSTSTHLSRRSTARLQEVVQSFAAASPDSAGGGTNASGKAVAELPAWLKAVQPADARAGISLVVIQ